VVDLIESRLSELRTLCERYQVERLALFGSAESYFGLLEELEELFARRVDLVEIEAVRNPYLRQEIEAGQETLYAAA
jgi:predicted nucleotidyltransferase